jgi:2-keto-4-pentenoate hydratase
MPPMTSLEDDPRVRRGMERQLDLRRRMLADGARPIGWKLGLGTSAAMEQHGTSAPLVGFLTDRTLLEAGDVVGVGGWGKPTAEPEIAVHVAADLPPAADRATVAAVIAGLGVAFEIVDISGGEVEEILAGDIFHRHVVLGAASAGIEAADLRGEIAYPDEVIVVDDPLAQVPEPIAAVTHLSAHLAAFGETVKAGDVLITGSIVPALALTPGDRVTYRLEPLGALTLDVSGD